MLLNITFFREKYFLKIITNNQKNTQKTKPLNVMIKIYIFVRCRGGSAG